LRSILVSVNTWILHCKEPIPQNSKQIFPEKDLRGHSPNFRIYVTAERFIYSNDRYAYSAAGNMWTDPGNI
jgi:hypothetical protein